jgi:hypothetical protein
MQGRGTLGIMPDPTYTGYLPNPNAQTSIWSVMPRRKDTGKVIKNLHLDNDARFFF